MADSRTETAGGVVQMVNALLARAITNRASDVHFEPTDDGMWVRYRLDGLLQDVDRLPGSLAENVVARLKVMAGLLTYRVDIPQEGSFSARAQLSGDLPPLDLRVATFPTIRGERAVVRLLYGVGRVSGMDELGLAEPMIEAIKKAARRPHGLILVTGPAGSGKSTTLYATAGYMNSVMPGRSLVSLEDPVEQRVSGLPQIQVQPHGELDYVRAMRSLLRQDVQALLVGEIRDSQTAHIVIEAALTGHLIMSTLHSGDPAEAIVRLLEMGLAPYQVVGALHLVCAQRLVRVACPACQGKGCESCSQTGYRGRSAIGQYVVMDDTVRQAVLDRRPAGELRRILAQTGLDLMADAGRLLKAGRTTAEEIQRVVGAGPQER